MGFDGSDLKRCRRKGIRHKIKQQDVRVCREVIDYNRIRTTKETSYEKSIAKTNKNQAASLEGLKGISEVKSLKMTLVSL